jgi:hypothetical protein
MLHISARRLLALFAHATIFVLILLLLVSTVRYIAHFYSSSYSFGDKAIPLLYFQAILAIGIMVAAYFLGKVQLDRGQLTKVVKYVELGVPLAALMVDIIITLMNVRDL